MKPDSYRPLHDLPPIAGITSIEDAMRIGFSIDDCVARLKRHHWAFRRLHEIFLKRLTAEPIYELKMAFSLHAYYCAEHAAAWRNRVGEMREPPLGLDVVPHPALDVYFDEILAAPETDALLLGTYGHVLPALREALQRHIDQTNCLVDHPSFRLCRFALIEVDEMIAFGTKALASLLTPARRDALREWTNLLDENLALANGLDGAIKPPNQTPGASSSPSATTFASRASASVPPPSSPALVAPASPSPRRQYSATPPPYDKRPRRDERFPDPYNMGVHAEAFLYDEQFPPLPKTLMMYYKRLREIDVPEMMASIIAETPGKPWQYTVDMTRQLWDEARHAMMGEVGFVRAGIDWRKLVRINFTWSLALNTQLTPIERHAVLYFIEQGLMPRNGKRFEWETGVASGDAFAAMVQDYDWADEVLHARIGRDWYVKAIGDPRKAVEYGDECWSRVLIDWQSYRKSGLTQHENWWPATYREWCRVHQLTPDPAVLAYSTSYEQVRADLKEISASA
jgi:hypothetical protein